jgi:hypothetical protein
MKPSAAKRCGCHITLIVGKFTSDAVGQAAIDGQSRALSRQADLRIGVQQSGASVWYFDCTRCRKFLNLSRQLTVLSSDNSTNGRTQLFTSPFAPVTRTPSVMRKGDDKDFCRTVYHDDVERKAFED